jgi:hypothetical protein
VFKFKMQTGRLIADSSCEIELELCCERGLLVNLRLGFWR